MTKIGSLFTGYGGLDAGTISVLGGSLAWVSDVKPAALKLLAHRYPTVPNLGDITAVDWSDVEPVDIITGGSPCQDLSTAGRRAGMTDGTRSNLWVQMRNAVEQLRPRYVVWENVRGAYSADAASAMEPCAGCVGDQPNHALRALGRVLGDLAELRYDAQWRGLRAADVGAPHGRFRVFLLATDTGRIRGQEGRNTAPGQADSGEPLSVPRGRGGTPATNADSAGLERPPHRTQPEPTQRPRHPQPSTDRRVDWGPYAAAIRRWELATGHPAPNPIDQRGRLDPALPEWMMGLPPGWITGVPGMTRTEALSLAGDGVVPQQAAAAIADMLTDTPTAA